MIDFSNCLLLGLCAHRVGNKLRGEEVSLSIEQVKIESQEIRALLMTYFLSPFKGEEFFNFSHPTDLKYNELHDFSKRVFNNPDEIFQVSTEIAKHLYESSIHPKVSQGELYVAYFKDCILGDELVDAIGYFKSESRETYMKVQPTSQSFSFISDRGINVNKLDKGCLVFNTDVSKGFKIAVVDNLNKSKDAQYWTRDFLNVTHANDNYHQTEGFLTITKDFVTKHLPQEVEIERADQVELLNKSMNFFKENERFDRSEFVNSVFQKPEIIHHFQEFESDLAFEGEAGIPDEFDISRTAVKKKSRVFKSVLKLDKNFHVYIHGNRDLIEKGIDPDTGKKYYKIYYDEEA